VGAASLAVHLLVLSLIGFSAPKLKVFNAANAPAIRLWLAPRSTPESQRRAAESRQRSGTAQAPLSTPPKTSSALNAPTSPGTGLQGSPGSRSIPGTTVDPAGGGVREALRTSVGCDYEAMIRLTPAERDRCNQIYGEQAKRGPASLGVDPSKLIGFAAEAAANERRRALREGPMPNPISSDCGDMGVGCLPDSAITHVRPH